MMSIPRRKFMPLLLGLGIVIAACGGGGGSNTGTPPGTIAIAKTSANSGDAQGGTVGQPLAAPLNVIVTENGTTSAGNTVVWGTGVSGGSLNPGSSVTDANGVASSTWTLGTVAGSQTAIATLTGAAGSPVIFSATAAPGAATSLAKAGGDNQTGQVGAPLPAPVQAKAADQFGNGVPGVNVAWAATGGTVSAAAMPTDGSGVSAINVTAGGTAGPITITATAGNLTGSPLTFNATAAVATPVPTAAAVTVGDIFFTSVHNGSSNPAVDTVAVNGTVTWTWAPTEVLQHSVQSTGSPHFTSSAVQAGAGQTYQFTFTAPGTYQYDCAIHGIQMTGRMVVR
jgi:plastocyanin